MSSDPALYRERLELALEAAGLDLWENNLVTGTVTQHASKTFRELGYADEEVPRLLANSIEVVHPDDREMIRNALAEVAAGETVAYRCEFRLRSRAGEWVWFANHGRVMDADAPTPGQRFIGVTYNIDERKRRESELAGIYAKLEEQNALLQSLNKALQELAATDALTGLANRRTLMDHGANECKRAERYGHALSLVLVDIDHFKNINDQWGHLVGDRVIRAAAKVCRDRVREGLDMVARLGGEEYVLLLPETDGPAAALLSEELRRLMADEVVLTDEDEPVNFTVSIGVASFVTGLLFNRLLHHADKALYRAKRNGRDQVRRYEDEPA